MMIILMILLPLFQIEFFKPLEPNYEFDFENYYLVYTNQEFMQHPNYQQTLDDLWEHITNKHKNDIYELINFKILDSEDRVIN